MSATFKYEYPKITVSYLKKIPTHHLLQPNSNSHQNLENATLLSSGLEILKW